LLKRSKGPLNRDSQCDSLQLLKLEATRVE
jgi:hypothetical protein